MESRPSGMAVTSSSARAVRRAARTAIVGRLPLGAAQGHVVAGAELVVGEVLEEHADAAAQVGGVDLADVDATHAGRPLLGVVEAQEDLHQAGLQTDIAWKAAAGLALTDEAFHPTVLVLWRNKLRASEAPQRIFDAVRTVINASGVIANKHRRALDSTVLDDAVARQDTVTMLVTQIRRVRRLIPELASVWVREHNLEGGRPPCDWEDPADIDRLVSELVDDANELVWAVEDRGLTLTDEQADAVALLALVAGQDVEPGDGPGQWRIAQRTAPDRAGRRQLHPSAGRWLR